MERRKNRPAILSENLSKLEKNLRSETDQKSKYCSDKNRNVLIWIDKLEAMHAITSSEEGLLQAAQNLDGKPSKDDFDIELD